jgi:hypothetical protein
VTPIRKFSFYSANRFTSAICRSSSRMPLFLSVWLRGIARAGA